MRKTRMLAQKELNLSTLTSRNEEIIRLKNVQIRDDEKIKIKDLSLNIYNEEKVAIISDSNTPTSAIFHLLLQFNLETSGFVYLNGQIITSIKLTSLRNQFFYLDKTIPLFSSTLRQNIHPSYPETLRSDQILTTFDILQKFGFNDPNLSEMGLGAQIDPDTLSPDERTAIGMARLFMDKKKVCLLDRVDARFDLEGILQFGRMMQEELQESTVLMVCERICTAEYFDRVVVFENGEIVADGDPDSLKMDVEVEEVGRDGEVVKVRRKSKFMKMLEKEREVF
jgi:ABC-type multidrug transport system fused ATPase/permease subunit